MRYKDLHDETSGTQVVGMLLQDKHNFVEERHRSERFGIFVFDTA